jgi:biopolymer transport protein ExbD
VTKASGYLAVVLVLSWSVSVRVLGAGADVADAAMRGDLGAIRALLQKGADVRLPLAANTAEKPETQEQTVLAVDKNDRFFVNGLPVRKEELRTKVEEILENKKERIILIKADMDARYSAVMDAMDELRASGIEDIGLITDPKSRQGLLGGGGGK